MQIATVQSSLAGQNKKGEIKTDAPKSPPNPYGNQGKQDHKDKISELRDKALTEAKKGETVETGTRIKGHDSARMPDVQIIDAEGKTRKVSEAERNPTHKRNQSREAEYDRLGIENETHGVGQGKGKGEIRSKRRPN